LLLFQNEEDFVFANYLIRFLNLQDGTMKWIAWKIS